MFKKVYEGDFLGACEFAGIDPEFAEAMAFGSLVNTLDIYSAYHTRAGCFAIVLKRRHRGVQGFALSEPLSLEAKPTPPKPPSPGPGPCRIYPATQCLSFACAEDGFCRQTGEEIITALAVC